MAYIPKKYEDAWRNRGNEKSPGSECDSKNPLQREIWLEEEHARKHEQRKAGYEEAAKELTKDIMREVGLGFPPEWYTGDCLIVRRTAIDRLPGVIRKHFSDRNSVIEIAPPYTQLIDTARQAMLYEERNTPIQIHRTWHVIQNVIAKHIEIAPLLAEYKRQQAVEDAEKETQDIITHAHTEEEKNEQEQERLKRLLDLRTR